MAGATGLDYSDFFNEFMFDTNAKPAAIADFYVSELAKTGWTAESKTLKKVDDADKLVFKNEAKETVTLTVTTVDGKTHAVMKYEMAPM